MKYEELVSKDTIGAFVDYIKISDAKSEGLIPEEYHEFFDDLCACGSDRIITKSLTSFMCCNPRCYIKVALSLSYLFDKFQCKNIGDATCMKIVKSGLKHMPGDGHVYFLTHGEQHLPMDLGGAAMTNFSLAVEKVRSSTVSFAEMVSRLGIPTLGSHVGKLFHDISSIQELIAKIKEAGSIQGFMLRRGVEDPMKVFYLAEFMTDIAHAELQVFKRMIPAGKVELDIVMTGRLYIKDLFVPKEQFLEICNKIGVISRDFRLFNITSSKSLESTQFLIASGTSNSNSYVTVLRRQEATGQKLIYTPEEFMEYLKERVETFKRMKGIDSEGDKDVGDTEVH